MKMPVSAGRSLSIIAVVAIVTFLTRAIPFLVFPKGKEIPSKVLYLGKVLPPAVIGMLIVYCFRNVDFLAKPHGAAELIASVVVVALHVWKRNNLLSIGVGTVLYMCLVQKVF